MAFDPSVQAVSQRGKEVLVLDNFRYNINGNVTDPLTHEIKAKYWRCCNYDSLTCTGRAITKFVDGVQIPAMSKGHSSLCAPCSTVDLVNRLVLL